MLSFPRVAVLSINPFLKNLQLICIQLNLKIISLFHTKVFLLVFVVLLYELAEGIKANKNEFEESLKNG